MYNRKLQFNGIASFGMVEVVEGHDNVVSGKVFLVETGVLISITSIPNNAPS